MLRGSRLPHFAVHSQRLVNNPPVVNQQYLKLLKLFLSTEMTMALIDAAHDHDISTREVIENSLFDLGKKKPDLILSSCYSYLKKHTKVN